jgi:hypothetical protein
VAVGGSLQKGVFVIDLGDAPIAGSTNRLPLYTQHFNTPVTRVELKRENKRTTLVLTLRSDVQPQVSSDRAKSGFFFLYVDFPAGSYLGMSPQVSSPAPPHPAGAASTAPPAPSVLDGDGSASADSAANARASASADAELPPGMAKPKAKASGKAKVGF